MKNITFSADAALIEEARALARAQHTTLNQLFRDWLAELADRRGRAEQVGALLEQLDYARSGGSFTRDEMNER
jgi:hypothetical protein